MRSEAFLVIDFGSSAVKFNAISLDGNLVAEEKWRPSLVLGKDLPLEVQYDAEEIERNLRLGCRSAVKKAEEAGYRIEGVGVTAQRFNAVLLDREGNAVLISPNVDSRGFLASKELQGESLGELYRITGLYPPHLFTPMRLEQIREQHPAIASRMDRILTVHDWIIYLLTGELVTDPTMAASTMLFDLRKLDWSDSILREFEVKRDALPEVIDSGSQAGEVTERASGTTGLREGTPVVACGGDSQSALIAMRVFEPSSVGIIAGYTIPILMATEGLRIDEKMRTWFTLHPRKGVYLVECNAGPLGKLAEWFLEAFRISGFDELDRLAALSPPGARGVKMRLYSSAMDAFKIGKQDVRGHVELPPLVIPGSSTPHLEDFARGFLEFVCMSLRAGVELAAEVAARPVERANAGGGMTRLRAFREILASVLRPNVAFTERPYTSSVGCAAMVATSLGFFETWEKASKSMAPSSIFEPPEALIREYQSVYVSWLEFYRRFEV